MSDRAVIAWKPKYCDARVASVRIRCLNPLSELHARGYPIELFDAKNIAQYKVVVYSKLYDDATYREAASLKDSGVRIVLDLCDNHFYNPSNLRSLYVAAEQLRRMMGLADYLVASTKQLADVMREELRNEKEITVIGDAVEMSLAHGKESIWRAPQNAYTLKRTLNCLTQAKREGRTNLVWYGIHGGENADYGMLDLLKLRGLLERLDKQYPLSLTVISNSRRKYRRFIKPWGIQTLYQEWRAATFLQSLDKHDVAIIPVTDNPFTQCKTNNRVALALSRGLAVVADSIPSYEEFRSVAFLDDWENGLLMYLSDHEMRFQHAALGKDLVKRKWSISRIADEWQFFFDKALDGMNHEKLF